MARSIAATLGEWLPESALSRLSTAATLRSSGGGVVLHAADRDGTPQLGCELQ
jgi:hypothetical protein